MGGRAGGARYHDQTLLQHTSRPPAFYVCARKHVREFAAQADERKLMGIKWMTAMTICFFFTWYYKRIKWSPIKTRRLELY